MLSVGYDSEAEVLEIELKNGTVQRFSGVPEAVHQELMSASSHGTYYDKHIRDRYPKRRTD